MTASAGPALQRLYREFGGRVAFATLYVREAHPSERYPQAETLEQKVAHARAYQERDAIPWTVAVDDVEGTLHRALGGNANAAYLVGSNGRVAFRTLWSNDERPLRQALEAVVSQELLPLAEARTRVVPVLKGVGVMDEVLEQAGPPARDDVRREALPVYGMAVLAGLFRGLPPLGRGIAAVATSVGALALLGGALGWLLTRPAEELDEARW